MSAGVGRRSRERAANPSAGGEDRRTWCFAVRDLSAAMAEPGRGAGYLPVIQLIKDWNHLPSCRSAMIGEGPPAALTRSQREDSRRCARPLRPGWVRQARAPQETTLVPGVDIRSGFGQDVRAAAPPVCHYRRVYFSVENLDST